MRRTWLGRSAPPIASCLPSSGWNVTGRTPVVTGNWKMNPPTLEEALALAEAVEILAAEIPGVISVVCPPTIWLTELARAVPGLHLGAQTMHFDERGAFTGETSPLMLDGLATFVILGH